MKDCYLKPILDQLQCLEDIGGPELDEYIEIMKELKKEITTRLENAQALKKEEDGK